MTDITQWTTIPTAASAAPAWIGDEYEQKRVAAYDFYEAIYLNVGSALKLQPWTDNANPIYLPAGRQIVDTLARFMAVKPMVIPHPEFGTDDQRRSAALVLDGLFKRERFFSKFRANKREGIYKGDTFWHLYADPNLPDGARVSIFPLDPGSCFPIYMEDNVDVIIGWHIAEQYMDHDGSVKLKRLTYRKMTEKAGPSPITVEEGIYKVDESGLPGMKEGRPDRITIPEMTLPQPIDHLPVYHVKNKEQTGTIWGRSELQGLERMLSAINQTISDEELALALEGLGVYVTDSGKPVNDDDEPVPWNLGPGRVVELEPNSKMQRVQGVGSVNPMQEHLTYLHNQLDGVSGTSPIAKGNVDVEIAESGIALLLQMGPILARGEEGEGLMIDGTEVMFYDLRKWIQAYEDPELSRPMESVQFTLKFQDPLPVNRAAKYQEIQGLYGAGIVTLDWVWNELEKLGYKFEDREAFYAKIRKEQAEKVAATSAPKADGDKHNENNPPPGNTSTKELEGNA